MLKKYFISLCWDDKLTPYFHLKDFETMIDEYVNIPNDLSFNQLSEKVCIGTLNPFTREYISCTNLIDSGENQCNRCKYMFDFYKCVKCHGSNCYVKSEDVLKYCNSPHYVYLAYFPNGKIKIGTASEVKKYSRLIEQGAIYSIFLAKTPTGKIARQIEKNIIDNGITGLVTNIYKMKNIVYKENNSDIKKLLLKNYKDIIDYVSEDNKKYLIEPEFNSFSSLEEKIKDIMLIDKIQINLFDENTKDIKSYEIRKDMNTISGKYLYSLGKILAIENNGKIELIDTKKLEGSLLDFVNIKDFTKYKENKNVRGK